MNRFTLPAVVFLALLALTWPAVAVFNLGEYMGWW